jgi:hypothetical protein
MLPRLRHWVARTASLLLVGGGVLLAHPTPSVAATLAAVASCSSDPATLLSPGGPAYYLFESNGAVVSCGAAPLHGSDATTTLPAPIVTGAATSAGAGYWLVTARGDVYGFGNAGTYGTPAHLRLRSPVVAFTPTPDGQGYWIVTAAGNLFHYGDAGFYGSSVRDRADGTVVSMLSSPDGKGYWIVTSTGAVHAYGDAPPVGSLVHRRPPVVAAAVNPDGHGLVLLTKGGGVHTLGTSGYYGSLVHRRLPRPLTSLATTSDGGGYLAASASGSIYNFGDALFEGSLAAAPPDRPTAVVALATVVLPSPVVATPPTTPVGTATLIGAPAAPTSLLPHGQFGYDISNFQCSSPGATTASSSLPPSASFAVIEAAGWLDNSDNPCLGAEAAWATAAVGSGGTPYSLYLFVNSPDQSTTASALDANGPAGQCSLLATSAQPACLAYNYGYEGALAAHTYATSVGVSAALWWLDVEGTNLSSTEWSNFSSGVFWSSSTTLNADTIQGAIDALHQSGATVGIYSSSVQFPTIAGSYVPSGAQLPLWVAGAPWTDPPYTESGLGAASVLSGWCTGTSGYSTKYPSDLFAGGTPWLLQETPGTETSPYGIDPNYAC